MSKFILLLFLVIGLNGDEIDEVKEPTEAFYQAIISRDIEEIKRIISIDNSIVESKFGGNTPLMWASMSNCNDISENEGIVKILLNAKVNVNAKNKQGMSAISLATSRGKYYIVKLLIDGNSNLNSKDTSGYTPLMWASVGYNTRYEYDENIDIFDYVETVKLLISAKANINVKSRSGDTALTIAKRKGHTEIVKLLKKSGAK